MLHGKYLCSVGISGWLCLARLKVDPAVPKPGGSCQDNTKEGQSQSEVPLWVSLPNPSSKQQCVQQCVQRCSAQIPSPSLGSFCFGLCVNLHVWLRTGPPAPCLSFPIWAEGLVWVCFCSGVQWRQVQSSTLKSSDEKHWRRTEAY